MTHYPTIPPPFMSSYAPQTSPSSTQPLIHTHTRTHIRTTQTREQMQAHTRRLKKRDSVSAEQGLCGSGCCERLLCVSVRVCVCVYMHANMHTIPQRRAPPDGLSLNSAWKSLIRLDLGVHIFNVPGFAFGV